MGKNLGAQKKAELKKKNKPSGDSNKKTGGPKKPTKKPTGLNEGKGFGGGGKRTNPQFFKKFEDKFEDYLNTDKNQGEEGEDFMFNKAPVMVKREKSSEVQERIKKANKIRQLKAKKEKIVDIEDSDSDEFYSTSKRQQTEADILEGDEEEETFFTSMKHDFTSFFSMNKTQEAKITKIPQMKVQEGTVVLGAICDKGPNGKYLEVNLGRNNKAFISNTDMCEADHSSDAKAYKIGEYVQGIVVPAINDKKLQISLKASRINKGVSFEDIFPGMIIQGSIESEEDNGYKINLYTQDRCSAFLKGSDLDLEINKCHMFTVKSKDSKKKVIQLAQFENASFCKIEQDQEELMGLDLSALVRPGNLTNVVVQKVLENGILVKFHKFFYGFIFQDHLAQELETYKIKQKLQARIIQTDYVNKQINLSLKQQHVELKEFDLAAQKYRVGDVFEGFNVQQCLFGKSFMVELQNAKKESTNAFLHHSHVEKSEEFKEGTQVKKPTKIKEVNYFEQYPIVTTKQTIVQKCVFWSDIQVGQIMKGTISSVQTTNEQYRVIVDFGDKVTGMIDHYNLSDTPTKHIPKHIKENNKINVRVLSVNPETKQLKLTLKQSLMDQTSKIFTNFDEVEIGQAYQGYIVKTFDFGFLIQFFNNINGLLSFKDIEEVNKMNRASFKIGQTVQVYISFVNYDEKKIGLSLSSKGVNTQSISNQQHKKVQKMLENVQPLGESDPEFTSNLEENLQVGEIINDYVVDKKFSENLSDYLILKCKTNNKQHKAIVLKQHLSDYSEHYEKMFDYYKNNQSNPKFQGLIIGKLENGYALVSLKPALISNTKGYINNASSIKKGDILTGYADYQTNKGIIVKIGENLKGFAQLGENKTVVNLADTLALLVKKVDGDKLYFQLANNYQISHSANTKQYPFLSYLKEDFFINRKYINKSVKKWQKYKIGNFISGKITLIKEYGIILNIEESAENQNITGFITNLNLKGTNKKNLKQDQVLQCQLLDIDYEKEILDLVVVSQDSKKEESKSNTLNLDLSKKSEHITEENKVFEAKVLLKKDFYQICKTEDNVLVIAECKGLNQQNDEASDDQDMNEEKSKNTEQKVHLKVINRATFGKNINEINTLNKLNYLPICEVIIMKKKEENNEEKNNNNMEIENDKKENKKQVPKSILAKLKVGGKIEGTVKNVKSNSITVQLDDDIIARLHKNLVEPGQEIKQGQTISAKILSIKKDKHLQVELTTLKSHLKLADEKLNNTELYPATAEEFLEKYGESQKPMKAVIKSVNCNSIHPIYIEFSNEHQGYISCFTGLTNFANDNLADEINNIKKLNTVYKSGQQIEVYVRKCENLRNIEVSLVKTIQNLDIGSVRVGKVCGSNNRNLRVQLDDEIFGQVDALEISDEWLPNPFAKFSKNDLVPFRVLSENANGEFELSLRESVLNKNNWVKALSPATGTTLNFKKMFGDQESNGDLRSRVFKLGPGCLKVGMIVIGYVNDCNTNGCYIRIGKNLQVRGQLNELSDTHIPNPQAYFYKNKIVIARIIKIQDDGKISVSLRESVIKFGYSLTADQMKVGMTVRGVISGHQKGKAIVQIEHCKYRGFLSRKDYEVEEGVKQHNYIEVCLPKGKQIVAKLIKLQKEPSVQLTLGTLKKYFENNIEEEVMDKKQKEEAENINLLIKSIQEISAKNTKSEKIATDIQVQTKKQQEDLIKEKLNEAIEQEEKAGSEEEFEHFEDNSDDENDDIIKNALQNNENEDDDEEEEDDEDEEDDEEEEEGSDDDDEIKSDQSVVEGDEEIEEISNKKKSRRQKELAKRKKEESIREAEQRLLNEDAIPESKDDFEKLILKNPNSSYVWIKYMAFSMEKEGISGARSIADRGLKVINFRNETEKLNIWTAYMNLEHNFGSEKHLIEVFQRACQTCKPKLIYFRLLDIYRKTENNDLLIELSKNMVKKFKHSSKAWLEHMKNVIEYKNKLIQQKKVQEATSSAYDLKEILKRSLQCMKKQKHIIVLSHYARLMFTQQEPEKGRTTFDAILSNYPKRTDIWSVFLDMETKYGTQQTVRNLYERCINMSFKPRKMKFFFKRYLQYELQFGTEEKAEIVKQKAQEYVQSLLGEDNENMDEENNNENQMEEEEDDE